MTSIPEITAKLNRLKAKRSALETKMKNQTKSERVSRTRTLIQMGGLIHLTEIPSYFDIELGDDLQTNQYKKDSALMLLGLLLTVAEQMPPSLSNERQTELKHKGILFMKKHQNQL